MSDMQVGFVGGIIATVIGFALSMVWDVYKHFRDTKTQDRSLMTAVAEDLLANIDIATRNVRLLEQEKTALDQEKSILNPLVLCHEGFWDLVKIRIPKSLSRASTLLEMRALATLVKETNEGIRSRENYRIHNGAMTNFCNRMKRYDEILIAQLTDVCNATNQFVRKYRMDPNAQSPGHISTLASKVKRSSSHKSRSDRKDVDV